MKGFSVKKGLPGFAAAVLVAVLLVSLLPSVWATPPQEPLRQTVPTPAPGQSMGTFTPEGGGTLISPEGDVTVTAPPGGVTDTLHIVYTDLGLADVPSPNAGFGFVGHWFSLEVYLGVTLLQEYEFAKPATICVAFTAEDVVAAGGDAENMVLQYYDEALAAWVDLETTVVDSRVCATVTHLTVFALAVRVPLGLPTTGGRAINPTLAIVVMGGMLFLASAGYYLRRTKQVP